MLQRTPGAVAGRVIAMLAVLLLLAVPAATTRAQSVPYWIPKASMAWQIQATGEIDPSLPVDFFVLPIFTTSADTVAAIHAEGKHVVCTVLAGVSQGTWPDAGFFRQQVLGKAVYGEVGQRWLDIRHTSVRAVIAARLDRAALIGCDAIDAGRVDSWYEDTGFSISIGDQLAYDRWLADEAHRRGMSIGLRGAVDLIPKLLNWYDFGMTESCLEKAECQLVEPFIGAGKPVFHFEYISALDERIDVCAAAREFKFSTILKQRNLDAWRQACA